MSAFRLEQRMDLFTTGKYLHMLSHKAHLLMPPVSSPATKCRSRWSSPSPAQMELGEQEIDLPIPAHWQIWTHNGRVRARNSRISEEESHKTFQKAVGTKPVNVGPYSLINGFWKCFPWLQRPRTMKGIVLLWPESVTFIILYSITAKCKTWFDKFNFCI